MRPKVRPKVRVVKLRAGEDEALLRGESLYDGRLREVVHPVSELPQAVRDVVARAEKDWHSG